jgi:hypothetical protein
VNSFFAKNLIGEADDHRTSSNAVNSLARDRLAFGGHGKVKAELEEQLVENVLLGTICLEMFDRFFECLREVFTVRLPRPDVAAGQLEDAEAEVARKQRILFPEACSRRGGGVLWLVQRWCGVCRDSRRIQRQLSIFIVRVE